MLSRFEDVGLIDDAAFADAWVESRHHGRGLARRALARELRTKGVDSDADRRGRRAARLRAGGGDRPRAGRSASCVPPAASTATSGCAAWPGMLARKGYPEGMALRVVRQALEEEGEDTELLDTEFLADDGS